MKRMAIFLWGCNGLYYYYYSLEAACLYAVSVLLKKTKKLTEGKKRMDGSKMLHPFFSLNLSLSYGFPSSPPPPPRQKKSKSYVIIPKTPLPSPAPRPPPFPSF